MSVRPGGPGMLIHAGGQPVVWEPGRPGSRAGNRPSSRAGAREVRAARPAPPVSSLECIDAVLFLDVDGVLHSVTVRNPRQQFSHHCMNFLKQVVANTQSTIVLSTAWREDAEAKRTVAERLFQYGLPCFVSQTPSIARFRRTREILAWVAKYRPLTWVAVDDLPLLEENQEMRNHFVQTHPNLGLRQRDVDEIEHLFQLQRMHLQKDERHISRPGSAASGMQPL